MGEVECEAMHVASDDDHKPLIILHLRGPLVWEKKRGRTRQPWMRARRDQRGCWFDMPHPAV